MFVNVTGGEIGEKETQVYLKRGKERYGDRLCGMDIHVLSEDEVTITYQLLPTPLFERIRRITGYLVGTMDKWNDAKRAEEHERVRHGV